MTGKRLIANVAACVSGDVLDWMEGFIVKINSDFLKRVVASAFPMALLSIQASISMGQDRLATSPSAGDFLPSPMPPTAASPTDTSPATEVAEQAVIAPQAPYGRQHQYQVRPSAGEGQPVRSRNWFRRSRGRMPHFIKLPPTGIPPAGENLNTFWAIQVSNGDAARMVLYDFDFIPGQADLTPRGMRQLAKFADMLQQTPHPLIIQPSPELPTLDEIRRAHILNTLATMDVVISEDRLIVRIPPSRGLDGIEAAEIQVGTAGGSTDAPSGSAVPGQ